MAVSDVPDIELRQVVKRFGDAVAVDGIDLRVPRGEFLALLGPSGCGKTTTLRMVAGFEQPTEGEILIGGHPAVGIPAHERDVNTVFQHYALFPHLSVLDNVAYGLKQRRIRRDERRRQAREALELVRLSEREAARPAELSGGQQQRVALARALVMRPRVLLLDEPLGALDQKLRGAMQLELKRIQRDVGITFIVVTHDQEEAMAMADRIAVMQHGRIDQLASPSETYDRPATPFVADFIGEMNHLEATVERAGDRLFGRGPAGATLEVGQVVRAVPAGRRARFGLRPEAITATTAGDGLPATAVTTMVLGHQLQLVARLEDGTELLVRQPRGTSEPALLALRPGDPLILGWSPEAVFLLEAAEGDSGANVAPPIPATR